MENFVKHNIRAGLQRVGLFLLLGCFTACGSYKTLNIDVLKPGNLNLEKGDVQILFLDRKIIHEVDSLSAERLYRSLQLKREDLVNCFYDGLRDGLRNGVRPVSLIRGVGLTPHYAPNDFQPAPISPEGIAALKKNGTMTHVLSVEYCTFNLDREGRLLLDNNLLLRLYKGDDGQVIDSMNSRKLGLLRDSREGDDEGMTICNFFYDKGWNYAGHLVPTWTPVERRVYVDNPILNVGYRFFLDENIVDARRIWNGALGMKFRVATKAAVNLAWLYEQEGNYTNAIVLLKTARQMLQKNHVNNSLFVYITDYINVLEQRVQDEIKMMEQL